MEFLPKPGQAKCVKIDLDPTRIGLRHLVECALIVDSKTILQALLPLLKRKKNSFLNQGFAARPEGCEEDHRNHCGGYGP